MKHGNAARRLHWIAPRTAVVQKQPVAARRIAHDPINQRMVARSPHSIDPQHLRRGKCNGILGAGGDGHLGLIHPRFGRDFLEVDAAIVVAGQRVQMHAPEAKRCFITFEPDQAVLAPILVITVWIILMGVGPPAFLTGRSSGDCGHSVWHQVGQLKRLHQVRVPDQRRVGHLQIALLGRDVFHFRLTISQRLVSPENRRVVLHGFLHLKAQFSGRHVALGITQPIKAAECSLNRTLIGGGHRCFGVHNLACADRGSPAKDHEVNQRVGPKPVGPMDRGTARLPHGHQARRHVVRAVLGRSEHFAPIIRRNAAHIVVDRRQDRNRFLGQVHTRKDTRTFRDAGQAQVQRFLGQVVQVQVDVIPLLAHAAPFTNFHRHAAADNIAAGQVFVGRRIALHKALAFGIGEVAALAPRPFGDQTASTVDASGVELHKLHILERQACPRSHPATVAGAGVSGRRREIGTAIATCRQHNHLRAEEVHRAVIQLPTQDALTHAVFGHDQVDGKVFDVEFRVVLERLPIERVQDRVAGPVGGRTGALHRGSFAELGGVATKRTLVNLALFGAGERHAVVFQLIDGLGRLAGEVFHRVRITQPVRAFDRVIHVPLPVVGAHVAERRGNAALRSNGVGPGREDLGHAGRAQPLFRHAQRGAQARATGTDNHHVIFMCFVIVSSHRGLLCQSGVF
mmetsp:Transcript_22347/g.35719  ORF Transcript_22347/g.35719 Transcript_22347/m.35719 type:complete len:683 (-) Transcript_22347:5097-7145(-)